METELEVDGGSSSISLVEVTEVAKHLRSGKAPEIDEIQTEMLKVEGVEGLSWLTPLFNIVRESGTVPKEWQTGISLFKKGDQRMCANFRVITLLRVLERRVRPIDKPQIEEE